MLHGDSFFFFFSFFLNPYARRMTNKCKHISFICLNTRICTQMVCVCVFKRAFNIRQSVNCNFIKIYFRLLCLWSFFRIVCISYIYIFSPWCVSLLKILCSFSPKREFVAEEAQRRAEKKKGKKSKNVKQTHNCCQFERIHEKKTSRKERKIKLFILCLILMASENLVDMNSYLYEVMIIFFSFSFIFLSVRLFRLHGWRCSFYLYNISFFFHLSKSNWLQRIYKVIHWLVSFNFFFFIFRKKPVLIIWYAPTEAPKLKLNKWIKSKI